MHKPSYIHRISHKIKSYLSRHISLYNLRRLAFVISLISCLVSGSILLFSLFSTSLHNVLGLTYLQINTIASFSACGMYFCLPVLGYLADSYGPALLSLFSIWFFCPSYLINSWLVTSLQREEQHAVSNKYIYAFCFTFCLIGLATSSLYFSSLITCARIFPNHKGLAISLPITCYGFSALIGSQLLKLDYFIEDGHLNLYQTFKFFGILYFIIGGLNFISSSIAIVEQELIFNLQETESPIIPEECLSEEDDEESLPLIPSISRRSSIEPLNHHTRFMQFLRDKSAWLLLVSLVLNIGPMESYQNNLGSILMNISPRSDLSDQVSLMATASTITRLLVGGTSDYLATVGVCRVWLLILVILVGVIGQYANGILDPNVPANYASIAMINGISYGGMFTLYPTIVASIWGIDIMGSTWGSFMVAPATGSILYSLFYGHNADSKCNDNSRGKLFDNCLSSYFTLTSLGLISSCIL
ncbi:putative transporter MCH1 [Spathaspora sp. JA1]|nr:putative transporter MCH1 [Spathaspora sp. JA1]